MKVRSALIIGASIIVAGIVVAEAQPRATPTERDALAIFPNGCPSKGWSEYSDAQGRFLLGRGGAYGAQLAEQKGNSEIKIADINLPDFGVFYTYVPARAEPPFYHGNGNNMNVLAKKDGLADREKLFTTVSGANTAIPTMPPYLAVAFCKRDPSKK